MAFANRLQLQLEGVAMFGLRIKSNQRRLRCWGLGDCSCWIGTLEKLILLLLMALNIWADDQVEDKPWLCHWTDDKSAEWLANNHVNALYLTEYWILLQCVWQFCMNLVNNKPLGTGGRSQREASACQGAVPAWPLQCLCPYFAGPSPRTDRWVASEIAAGAGQRGSGTVKPHPHLSPSTILSLWERHNIRSWLVHAICIIILISHQSQTLGWWPAMCILTLAKSNAYL